MNVYLIHAEGTDRYKIGITARTIEYRMKELNSSQSAYPLVLIKSIRNQDYKSLETHLHAKYATYRRHGEWFSLTQNQLIEVQNYMQTFDQPLSSFKPIIKQNIKPIIKLKPQPRKHNLSLPLKNWLLPLTLAIGLIYVFQNVEFFQPRPQTHHILRSK